MRSLRMCIGAALGCLTMVVSAAHADESPYDLLQRGVEQFEQGDYEKSLQAYEQIDVPADSALWPEWLHDRAAAQFKLGRYDEARELWVRAASRGDAKFEADCRYNLANCDYRQALQAMQSGNAQQALELVERARQNYLDALRLHPALSDARANLELATQLKQTIEQASQQSPQSQPSEQNQQQQDQQQDSQQQQQGDQQQDQQSQDQQRDQSGQQDGQQQSPPQTSEQPDQQQQQQGDKQQQEQQESETGEQQEPQPEQQPRPQERGDAQQQTPVPVQLTKEQAQRLLQLIRDAERQRREALRVREARQYKPTEKDW